MAVLKAVQSLAMWPTLNKKTNLLGYTENLHDPRMHPSQFKKDTALNIETK